MKKFISLILVALVLFSISGCKKALEGGQPDAEIVSNGGIVTKQGDWIYYINGSMPFGKRCVIGYTKGKNLPL